MKIRNSFVTNSSSSSFVLIGVECELDRIYDVMEEKLKTIKEGEDKYNLELAEKTHRYMSDEKYKKRFETTERFFANFGKNDIDFHLYHGGIFVVIGLFDFYNRIKYGNKTINEIHNIVYDYLNEVFDDIFSEDEVNCLIIEDFE